MMLDQWKECVNPYQQGSAVENWFLPVIRGFKEI
jgi:hypothetical protein